jgi:DNA-binding LacI/PurR family transcriptional regulator
MTPDRIDKLLMGGRKKAQILADFLFDDMKNGVYQKDEKLPSYDDLGQLYQINRLTVRKAIKVLEERDVVHSISAKGTYAGSAPKSQLNSNSSQKTLVGIVSEIVDFETLGYHHLELISALSKECGQHGHQMNLVYRDEKGKMNISALKEMSGVLAIGPLKEQTALILAQLNAFVHIDPQKSSSSVSVSADYQQGGRLAAEHFLQLGHQHCAVIHGDQPCCDLIWSGFHDVMEGQPKVSVVSYHGNYTAPSASMCVQKLLKKHPKTTAIFCMNDEMAAGAIQCLSRHGLKIPQDMSVLGFDDSAISTLLDPPLQTIGISTQHIAQVAVSSLLAQMEDANAFLSSSSIFPQMVKRESTGGPRES